MKNGDRWQIARVYDDGSLAVQRVGRGDQPYGKALVLPTAYVREDLELGYATTAHRAQGASVDSANALVDPDTASRELFYVAMTRGKQSNTAYVIVPDPDELEAHLDRPEEKTLTERLAAVLKRSDDDLSATETLKLEVDRHASLDTLLAEYDVLGREAQTERWASFLDVAPFPENVADQIFTSPYYEALESALARHEAAGHIPTIALAQLAPRLTLGEDETDPAVVLAKMIDQATQQLPQGKGARRRRVAGLIATPAEPADADMRRALGDRQNLIEAAARQLAQDALDSGAMWTKRFGTPPDDSIAKARWGEALATLALYRYRYSETGTSPVGQVKRPRTAEQAAENRAAVSALTRAQTEQVSTSPHARSQATRAHRLSSP